jgi:hypothetical protein
MGQETDMHDILALPRADTRIALCPLVTELRAASCGNRVRHSAGAVTQAVERATLLPRLGSERTSSFLISGWLLAWVSGLLQF